MIEMCRSGHFPEAIRSAQRVTRDYPDEPIPWNVLATAAGQLGRRTEAREAYEHAKRLEPGNPGTRNNLGLVLMEEERFDDAAREFETALRIKPDFFQARYNLALANERGGHIDDAATHYRAILEQHPDSAETHDRLANVLAAQGKFEDAMAYHAHAIDAAPDVPGYQINRGNRFAEQGYPRAAERAYRAVLASWPDCIEAYNNLADLLTQDGSLCEAERITRAGLAQSPAHPDLVTQLAAILSELGQIDRAIAACEEAIAINPRQPAAYDALGNALADAGEFDRAEQAYRQALEHNPSYAQALHHLAVLRKPSAPEAELSRIRSLLAEKDLPPKETAWLHYAAGKLSADAGEHPETTFNHYQTGADRYRQLLAYSVESDVQHLTAVERAFTRDRIDALASHGHPSEKPVFIVGMPRSGTSLIEQILASHPQVYGAGERRDMGALVSRLDESTGRSFPDWLADPESGPETIDSIGAEYCNSLGTATAPFDRFTDKMPGNFVLAGLIVAALPNARIIHVRRHPLDTCLSCFFHLFGGPQPFSYNLEELGRYYRAYASLMTHWRETIPATQLLEVNYEDVISSPENTACSLVEHCGLDWDSRCLAFHQTERAVRTLSANQVRQPLYGDAIGRWRKYSDQLAPLIAALGPLADENRP